MEFKDKTPMLGKLVIIVSVLSILVFSVSKGYEWVTAEVSKQIEVRAAETYDEGYGDGYNAGYAITIRKQEIITGYAGEIGYIAGYYAHELGAEIPYDIRFFEEHYQEVTEYIPDFSYWETMQKLEDAGQNLTTAQMLEMMRSK